MGVKAMRFAENYCRSLHTYMEAEAITTNALATKSGISQKTIWVVQAGKSVPTVNTIQSISAALPIDGRIMLGSELTFDQLQRTAKVGRVMDDLIKMSTDQIDHIRAITKAFLSN